MLDSGSALALAKTPGSSGIPSSALAQRRDSLSTPLLGFHSPSRYDPNLPAFTTCHQGRSRRLLSWGFLPLQRSRKRESTSASVTTGHPARSEELPGALLAPCKHGTPLEPGIYRRFPPRRLRGRSQAFPASQRSSSSRVPPTIFRWVALLGFRPPGVYTSHEAPAARHCWHTLLTFFPPGALPLFLGRGSVGIAGCT